MLFQGHARKCFQSSIRAGDSNGDSNNKAVGLKAAEGLGFMKIAEQGSGFKPLHNKMLDPWIQAVLKHP